MNDGQTVEIILKLNQKRFCKSRFFDEERDNSHQSMDNMANMVNWQENFFSLEREEVWKIGTAK